MTLKWFVQTCGQAYETGYRWVHIAKNDDQDLMEEPEGEIIPDIYKVDDLVFIDEFSIFLACNKNELVLQVTGLKSERKSSYRSVSNTLVCIGDDVTDKNDERILRAIAISALHSEYEESLSEIVDSHIDSVVSNIGFEIRSSQLIDDLSHLKPIIEPEAKILPSKSNREEDNSGLPAPEENGETESNNAPYTKGKFGCYNQKYTDEIAVDLSKHELLPQDGLFYYVIVSSVASGDTLERHKVWRGLSSKIEDEDWYEYDILPTVKADGKSSSRPQRGRQSGEHWWSRRGKDHSQVDSKQHSELPPKNMLVISAGFSVLVASLFLLTLNIKYFNLSNIVIFVAGIIVVCGAITTAAINLRYTYLNKKRGKVQHRHEPR